MPDPAFTPGAHRLAEPRWFEDLQLGERFLNPSRTMTEALFAAFHPDPLRVLLPLGAERQ